MPSTPRLLSLDVFRGLTIAAMILVNNPGSWGNMYPPLRHAPWNGWTPTDLVFPFFLFIVGVSMAFSLARREANASRGLLLAHSFRRGLILFLLGLSMYGFPDFRLIAPFLMVIIGLQLVFPDKPQPTETRRAYTSWFRRAGLALLVGGVACFALDFAYFDATALRVPGVLQRIALCYFLASVIVLGFGLRGAAVAATVLIGGYALVVTFVSPPSYYAGVVVAPEGLLHDWIDVNVLGNHLYAHSRPDPEGLLSSLPATATTLLGVLTGAWLRRERDPYTTTAGLFVVANIALVLGLSLDAWVPINKQLWSSSYVLLSAGLALHVLAMCYWLIDVRQCRRWAWPLLVFGSNAIVVFVASSLLAKMLYRWHLGTDGPSVGAWIYGQGFASWAAPQTASLLYAIVYVLLWLALMVPLYRRRIFVKI